MKVSELGVLGVKLIEPKVFGDSRGFFMETWQAERYAEVGLPAQFVQDNLSRSTKGVLRGMHLQNPGGQGKLVSVLLGAVLDVALDVRPNSPTFGKWVSQELSEENHHQMYIPPGCAHGFCVLSEAALFHYKCTDFYQAKNEVGVRFDDPEVGIAWPQGIDFSLSEKDVALPKLSEIPQDKLPSL